MGGTAGMGVGAAAPRAKRRLGSLGVRGKLALLVAVPFSLSVVVLGLFVVEGRLEARSSELVMAWSSHATAVWDVEVAADRYLDVIEARLERRATDREMQAAFEALEREIVESVELAKGFSAEERRSEAKIAAALNDMTRQGAAALAGGEPGAVASLRHYFRAEVLPRLERRMEEEVRGIDATLRAMRAQNARLRDIGLLVACLLLLGAFGATWTMAARFSSSLTTLTHEARRVAAGERVEPNGREPDDEFGDLGRAFHEMAAALERQRHDRFSYLASLAHDLRNPLAVLKLAVQTITSTPRLPEEERVRQTFALVSRQVDGLGRMVSDLLDAARVEAGELELRLDPCDLRPIVRAAVELYVEAAPRHELRADIPDEPMVVQCDAARIGQVLNNLVSNAIKYSPAGSRVAVRLVQTPSEAVISVADRGRGIPPEDREAIFEPFRRLPSTRDEAAGTGLGLAIARRIALAHGGSLCVESTPGEGATFTLRLPVLVPPDAAC